MKGDVINLTRLSFFRLALGALLLALAAISIYWAGNLQELSDPALLVAINWAEGSSIAALGLASLSVISTLLAPFFSGRFSLLTLLGSVIIIATSLGGLAFVSSLKVLTGGLPL